MNIAHPLVLISVGAIAAILLVKATGEAAPKAPDRTTSEAPKLPEQRQPLLTAIEIEGTRAINDRQTITTLRIPDAQMRHNRHFDRYCVIYEHTEYRSVSVICDGSLSVSGNTSGNNPPAF